MPYVRFTGTYRDFITGRDVDSAVHYEDGSDQTNVGFVRELKAGDVEIEEAEYESVKATIRQYNEANTPPPPVRPPPPDVGGYMLAVYAAPPTGLGEERAQEIAMTWPQGPLALQAGNWALARGTIAKMFANTNPKFATITRAESDLLLALMTAFNIPDA